jgi:hypothetical protein
MHMRAMHPRRGGLALILVLIILFTLMVIAAPFLTSMVLYERSSFGAIHQSRAVAGAQSAMHYAAVRTLWGTEYYERTLRAYGDTSYAVDSLQELQISLDAATATAAGVGNRDLDPWVVWGISVEDEQGKIHLPRAPRNVQDSVVRLAGITGADPRDFTTLYSTREMHWVHPQRARGFSPSGDGVSLDRMNHFGRGARVRITSPSLSRPVFSVSDGLFQDPTTQQTYVRLNPPPPSTADTSQILEVEARVPINVNTAVREALAAVFRGLRLINPLTPGEAASIDDSTALSVAGAFYQRIRYQPFTNFYEVASFVQGQGGLTDSQKLAILVNAIDPTHVLLDGSGTLPFVYRSHDVYTIRASCSVNDMQGTETASHHIRSVVELTPPMVVQHRLETQTDWDRFLTTYVGPNTVLDGYPYGNKMATFPNLMPAAPPEPRLSAAGQCYVQMRPSKDLRGQVAGIGNAQPFMRRYHYDNEIEGRKLGGGAETFPHTDVFAPAAGVNHADIAAGGAEYWVRFDGAIPSQVSLFDCREGGTLNRITFEYSNGELVLTVADETIGGASPLSNGTTVCRMPFQPQPEIWYHVGAYFKGNKFGQLLVLRDGFAQPQGLTEHLSASGARIWTRLRSDLPAPTDPNNPVTPVDLEDSGWIPAGQLVPLEIGSEVVLYDAASGTAIRGARGTQAYDHPARARVSVFGYTTQFAQVNVNPAQIGAGDVPAGFTVPIDGLPRNGTTVASPFTTNDRRRLARTIGAAELTIPVVSQAFYSNPTPAGLPQEFTDLQQDFPQKGYVRIGNEMIKYDGFASAQVRIPENDPAAPLLTVPALRGQARGGLGTQAAAHNQGANTRVASLHVADNTALPDPVFVQAEGEWFGPLVRDPGDGTLYVPPTSDGNAHNLGRGIAGTGRQAHAAGERVIPIFAARPNIAGPARYKLGGGDEVTLTDASLQRSAAVVRRAIVYQGTTQLAALYDYSPVDYAADGMFARILKFPSAELISRSWLAAANPSVLLGPMDATIDEVKFFGAPKSPEWRLNAPIPNSTASGSAAVGSAGSLGSFGGAIRVGDEVLGYGELNQAQGLIQRTVRGYLGSTVEVHDAGDLIFNLAFLPLSSLRSAMSATQRDIDMNQGIEIAGQDGMVLIDGEVMYFTRRSGNTLTMPSSLFGDDGIYRGRFGTTPSNHDAFALVYGIPWRFYDTYRPREFDTTMAWYQFSTVLKDAHYRSCRWNEQTWPNILTHAEVRFDGRWEFFDGPDGRTLLDLQGGSAAHRLDQHVTRTEDALLEVRFRFEFLSGAFYPGDAWKQSPKLYDVALEYERPWRVLYHEER